MLNSCKNVFTGSGEGGGKDKQAPCENTHMDFVCLTHKCTKELKDAGWLLMSAFWRGVISKLGYRRVLALRRVLSTPFTFNSNDVRVSTSSLMGG